jgi:hypothetical protein
MKGPRPARIQRRLSAALVLTFLLAWPEPARPATVPPAGNPVQPGVVPDITWGIPRGDVDMSLTLMRRTGARWARLSVGWHTFEQNGAGRFDAGWLDVLDYAVTQSRAAGLDVLLSIAGVPYWASADPNKHSDRSGKHWNVFWHPAKPADFARFVGFVVNRYQSHGVHAYEIWTEPNHPYFWPSGPDAAGYVDLLRPAAAAVREHDPAGIVVLGALSKNDAPFLDKLYAAGAAPHFDVAAVNYLSDVDPRLCWFESGTKVKAKEAFCGLEAVHDVMAAHGEGGKTIWMPELGWSSATGDFGVGEEKQAQYLRFAFAELPKYPYVTVACWYSLRNTPWHHDDPDLWKAQFGLVRTDYSPKPALAAYGDVTAALSAG